MRGWLRTVTERPVAVGMLTLAGVGIGGILDWGLGASQANESEPLFIQSFSISVR